MTEDEQHHQITAQEVVEPTSKIHEAGPGMPAISDESKMAQKLDPSDEDGTPLASPSRFAAFVDTLIPSSNKPVANVKHRHREADAIPPITSPREPVCSGTHLFEQIKQFIDRRTGLPERVSAVVAFWAISTWFQEALAVLPCLVITGPSHEAMMVLLALKNICCSSGLVSGFKPGNLNNLSHCLTQLISETNLDSRTCAMLGDMTNRGFMFVTSDRCLYHCVRSRAVYVGEDRGDKRIQHSIYIDVTSRSLAKPQSSDCLVPTTSDALAQYLAAYRARNMSRVRDLEFNPRGLSLEAHAVANALGSCVIDAPELQMALVDLLRAPDRQQIAERADSNEALVANVALTLSHEGKDQVFVKEITAAVNRLLEARQAVKMTPEKIGHILKRIGLPTRRLSHAGNGLNMDQETTNRIHEVADSYHSVEDCIGEERNLQCSLCQRNERRGKDM